MAQVRCRGEGCGRILAYPRQQSRYDGLCPICERAERGIPKMVIEKVDPIPPDGNKRHLALLRATLRVYG